jgi:hypothetical protein
VIRTLDLTLEGTTSLKSETDTGINPPTETPINQHMKTLVGKEGIAPQIDVAINRIVERRMEYLLPTRSAKKPHKREPRTAWLGLGLGLELR